MPSLSWRQWKANYMKEKTFLSTKWIKFHYNIHITLHRILSQNKLMGNVKTGWLGKAEVAKQQRDRPCSKRMVQQILRNKTRENWLPDRQRQQWAKLYFDEMIQQWQWQHQWPEHTHNRNRSLISLLGTGLERIYNFINPNTQPLRNHQPIFKCSARSNVKGKLLQPSPTVTNSLNASLVKFQRSCTFRRMALGCQK